MQVALKASQKQAVQLPQALERLHEVQAALDDKTQQHSMALHGVQEAQRVITNQEKVISEKDNLIAELRAELKTARIDGEKSRFVACYFQGAMASPMDFCALLSVRAVAETLVSGTPSGSAVAGTPMPAVSQQVSLADTCHSVHTSHPCCTRHLEQPCIPCPS